MLRYSNHFLAKLEDLISETDYILRYEKGNFKPGYCILNERKIIIVNKYYPVDGKINCLLEIIKIININPKDLSEKNRKLYYEQTQTEVKV
ncbi:MAG: hypothetical protein OEX02_20825 [Cyclobacteriaceae bacterium]|nr:hypothetical protein [Cyclobacteriaceae bacterium]